MRASTPLLPEEYDWLSERRGKLIRQGLTRLAGSDWFQGLGVGIDQQAALRTLFAGAEQQAEAELRTRFPNIDVRLHQELGREMERIRVEAQQRAA